MNIEPKPLSPKSPVEQNKIIDPQPFFRNWKTKLKRANQLECELFTNSTLQKFSLQLRDWQHQPGGKKEVSRHIR